MTISYYLKITTILGIAAFLSCISLRAGGTPVTAVAAGAAHSLYVTCDGSLYTMGSNYYGQLGDGTGGKDDGAYKITAIKVASNVVAVAGGINHSLYATSDGSLYAMGYNEYGQLGDGSLTNRNKPTRVAGATNVIAVAAGGDHSFYLTKDGRLYAMGDNSLGQLGDGKGGYYGDEKYISTPVLVDTDVVTMAAGTMHSLYVKKTATSMPWDKMKKAS